MSEQRVGTCSICGGSVYGIRGAWFGTQSPPPDRCNSCGAVAQSDVIRMTPQPATGNAQDFRDIPRESQQEYFGIKKK